MPKNLALPDTPLFSSPDKERQKMFLTAGYRPRTLDAMDEARRISRNPDVKGYTGMNELKRENFD